MSINDLKEAPELVGEGYLHALDIEAHRKEKRILRKIDLHILPMLCALCSISQIDRLTISTAKVAGMARDLQLTGNQ